MRFLLVHGTSHGKWCWDRLVPELRRLGHEAVAIDLPGHGERVEEHVSTIEERSRAIDEVLQPGDVVVGHSVAGLDITVAADRAPEKIGHLIYLAAALPVEGRTFLEAMHGVGERDPDSGEPIDVRPSPDILRWIGLDEQGRAIWTDSAGPREFFYQDCDAEMVAWAYARLTPAAKIAPDEVAHLSRFWQAKLPRSVIACSQDRVQSKARSRVVALRLGVQALEIEASHSPFLSRPRELAALMVKATATPAVSDPVPGLLGDA